MPVQRKTRNLGLNRSQDREQIYKYIENVFHIKKKKCGMGSSKKGNRYGIVHEGPNPLPIRNFNLYDAEIRNGKVVINSQDGLQGNCMVCERKYRAARIQKNRARFSGMSDAEIYERYKEDYPRLHGLKRCSRCHKLKPPEDFSISKDMETGLHNMCKECSKAYLESVGDRWAIYSPDGYTVLKISAADSCQICGTKEHLTKDHIFPLAKGGSDNPVNIQVLCKTHNFSKSDTLISPAIKSISDIKPGMICERYLYVLDQARASGWTIGEFDQRITSAVKEFIVWKKNLSDHDLREFFKKEKEKNNRKISIDRAVRKFRAYCATGAI